MGTLFTNVRVYALVPFLGRALEKRDYQNNFISVLAEGIPKVVQFDFAIRYESVDVTTLR